MKTHFSKPTPFVVAAVLAAGASSSPAATLAFDFIHGSFVNNTGIQSTETTAALDLAAGLDSPQWTNIDIATGTNGRGSGSASGITVQAYSANYWNAGSENVGAGSDASQQVFRVYLDDGQAGNSFFNGDGIGASIHITGIQGFLTSLGASEYTVTVFFSSDVSSNPFPAASVWSGVPGAPSATAITGLPLLGTTTNQSLGDGQAPLPSAGGSTTGSRGWGELTGLTSDDIVISMPPNTAGVRATVAGFAITAFPVPEPSTGLLALLGGIALFRRRR